MGLSAYGNTEPTVAGGSVWVTLQVVSVKCSLLPRLVHCSLWAEGLELELGLFVLHGDCLSGIFVLYAVMSFEPVFKTLTESILNVH